MSNLRKHIQLLETLAKCKPAMARAIIEKCDKDIIRAISELAHNTLKGNVQLNKNQLTKLRRYRKQLHHLANKRASLQSKKKVLQRGGFIPALLGTVIPIVASLIGGLVK